MNLQSPSFKNAAAIAYVLSTYSLGVGLLLPLGWGWNLVGLVLLTHALVLSTVLTHEFLHGNIFKARPLNARFGQWMTHLNGACYPPYEDLVQHHFNHHIHHADFVPFEIASFFDRQPVWMRRSLLLLEWAYFPIFEFILRWRLIFAPFRDPAQAQHQKRVLALLSYRTACFAVLGGFSLKALLLYGLAYTCFINLMRFADAFHHTYDYVIAGQSMPCRDRVYEQAHTFSNLVSTRFVWLNLLYLNFGYHNAHHHDMRCPWHELPQLHARLYSQDAKNLLPLSHLIANYHRFRLQRLVGTQGEADLTLATFTGGVGVSLLTPP